MSAAAQKLFDDVPVCERHLFPTVEPGGFKMEALNRLHDFRVLPLDDDRGIRIERIVPSRGGVVEEDLSLNKVDRLIGVEDWEYGGEPFAFMSAGFKNLENHSRQIHRHILERIYEGLDHDLDLLYDPRFRAQMDELKRWRWRLHDAVIGRYRAEKSYLRPSDLMILRWINELSHNSDVFAVLSAEPAALLATIQVSYQGNHNFLKPTLLGFLQTLDLEKSTELDLLPFEYRLSGPDGVAFRHSFYSYFRRDQVCEFTRYSKFDRMPVPVQERMLLKALQAARTRGMRTIVAGGDEKTARLFARYGFKVFGRLPTEQTETAEYLSYLRIPSKEYEAVHTRLKISAQLVRARARGRP